MLLKLLICLVWVRRRALTVRPLLLAGSAFSVLRSRHRRVPWMIRRFVPPVVRSGRTLKVSR